MRRLKITKKHLHIHIVANSAVSDVYTLLVVERRPDEASRAHLADTDCRYHYTSRIYHGPSKIRGVLMSKHNVLYLYNPATYELLLRFLDNRTRPPGTVLLAKKYFDKIDLPDEDMREYRRKVRDLKRVFTDFACASHNKEERMDGVYREFLPPRKKSSKNKRLWVGVNRRLYNTWRLAMCYDPDFTEYFDLDHYIFLELCKIRSYLFATDRKKYKEFKRMERLANKNDWKWWHSSSKYRG